MADHLLIPLPGRKAPMWKNNQQLIFFFLLAYRTLTKQGVEKEIKGIKDVLMQNKMHRDPHSPPHSTVCEEGTPLPEQEAQGSRPATPHLPHSVWQRHTLSPNLALLLLYSILDESDGGSVSRWGKACGPRKALKTRADCLPQKPMACWVTWHWKKNPKCDSNPQGNKTR